MDIILLIVAILPVLLLGLFIYKKDKTKEPIWLLVKLFISGIGACILVIICSLIIHGLFPALAKEYSAMNFLEFSIYIFIIIAFLEEGCKWLMTYIFGYKNKEFDEVYDIIVYAVFVALGFALLENLMYVFRFGQIDLGIYRGLLAIPGHTCDAIAMGYYLSLARYYETIGNNKLANINKGKSILVPTVYHGIYDFCCLTGSTIVMAVFFIFIIFLYATSLKKVKLLSEETKKIRYQNKFCPNCGTKIEGEFCIQCGSKQE